MEDDGFGCAITTMPAAPCAAANQADVRRLLRRHQPGFAAALILAEGAVTASLS